MNTLTDKQIILNKYYEKNAVLAGSGCETCEKEFFTDGAYELLYEDNEPVLYFKKSKMRGGETPLFYNFLVLDESGWKEAGRLLKAYLSKNRTKTAVFAVEEYLEDENKMVLSLAGEADHVSVRMSNHDICRNSVEDGPTEVQIEPFVKGKDESRFVKIFNTTFKGLCVPTSLDEVSAWTRLDSFDSNTYFFAEKHGRTVGFIAIETDDAQKCSYLQEIGVIDEEKGRGVSDALMSAGMKSVESKKIIRMNTGVNFGNGTALRFFKKWGFEELYKKKFMRYTG